MTVGDRIPFEEVIPYLRSLFETACGKEFESIHSAFIEVQECHLQPTDPSVYISAGNDHLKITLLMRVPHAILHNTLPAMEVYAAMEDEILEDWLLEMSNRLLCRIKNKLLDHDCNLKMGLPKATNVKIRALFDAQTTALCSRYFMLDSKVLESHLRVDILEPDFTLSRFEDEDEEWFPESELQHL